MSLNWIDDELNNLQQQNLLREPKVRENLTTPASVQFSGVELVNFGSNDYLGLAGDERLAGAVSGALRSTGWGAGASPLISGRAMLHEQLEEQLATLKQTEATLLFSSGFAANVGAINALAGKGDCIFSDSKNHASIIDGCRLSGAQVEVYRHCDIDDLNRRISAARNNFRRRLIVSDSVFSMDGDIAPVAEIAELAEQHGAMFMLDEAHATGVFGERGSGVAEFTNAEAGVHIRVGTLSKALGSVGGFVAGSKSLIQFLANRARSYVFSTAFPEAVCVAGLEALQIVNAEPGTRRELLAKAENLRNRLRVIGCNVGESASQIVPVFLKTPDRVMQAVKSLMGHGFFVPGIRPPSVPVNECLLRISLSVKHSTAQIDALVSAIAGGCAE